MNILSTRCYYILKNQLEIGFCHLITYSASNLVRPFRAEKIPGFLWQYYLDGISIFESHVLGWLGC